MHSDDRKTALNLGKTILLLVSIMVALIMLSNMVA